MIARAAPTREWVLVGGGASRYNPPVQVAVLALSIVLFCGGCAGSAREGGGSVEYSVSARQNYERGMKRLKDEDWPEAAKYFVFVKARFPYSKYAVLAELRLADTLFGAGQYLEAIDAYQIFIKYHPTHPMVVGGYAPFRIAEGYYKTLPSDWFLTPPSHEKDLSSARDAMRTLDAFLRKFPASPFRTRAETMHRACAKLLAAHEWYVAEFYWKRGQPQGTVLRLRTLLASYAGAGYDADALWLLGRAYQATGKPARAREVWGELIGKFPQHVRATQARTEIGKLPAPSAAASRAPSESGATKGPAQQAPKTPPAADAPAAPDKKAPSASDALDAGDPADAPAPTPAP